SSDVWAVGFYYNGPRQTLVEHWNGSTWSVVPSPNPDMDDDTLNGVTAISSSDVWAVGAAGTGTLTEHWNGSVWSVVPNPGTGDFAAVSAVSSSNVWAVGSDGHSHTQTLHWNGTAWSVIPSPSPGASDNFLTGVAAISSTSAWAVGYYEDDLIQFWTLIE